jgi:hypothetical protein
MATSSEKKDSSLFCCSCGDKDKNSEVVVDTAAKTPDVDLPVGNSVFQESTTHVPPARTYASPSRRTRVTFTYSSPVNNYRPSMEWAPNGASNFDYSGKRDGTLSFGSTQNQYSTNTKDSGIRHNYDLNEPIHNL